MKKRAFTLAETLITLMVIGIVAALTIPALMQTWKDRQYQSAYKKMYSTLMNGFNQMIAEETLAGNESTEELVEHMQKAFKISKTCGKDDLANCFASNISTDDKAIELSKIKTAKNLGKEWNPDTNVNGVMLPDGTSFLIAYNKECPTGGKDREKDIIQNCVAIVYDLDNFVKNNNMGKDIRTYNASISIGPDMTAWVNTICEGDKKECIEETCNGCNEYEIYDSDGNRIPAYLYSLNDCTQYGDAVDICNALGFNNCEDSVYGKMCHKN